ALLISPRLESDRVIEKANVDYVSIRRGLPKLRLRREVAAYLARLDWPSADNEFAPLVAEGGPLRSLVIRQALTACDIYADLAETLPALFARQRTNVVLGTDSGSVAGRCFFKTAEAMNLQT